MRLTIVTNIPTPYRNPVFDLVAKSRGIELTVIYFASREPDRAWNLGAESHSAIHLRPRFITWRDRYIHFTAGIVPALTRAQPAVVITDGFNPAHIAAFRFARRRGIPHIAMTDGTLQSERNLSWIHKLTRRYVFCRTSAFIGASNGSLDLYRSYEVNENKLFKSELCTDLEIYKNQKGSVKVFDFIFCSRFVPDKSPEFILKLAAKVSDILRRQINVLMVGSGPLESHLKEEAKTQAAKMNVVFAGFAQQQELPALYHSARISLFPTRKDVWGVVANEACAAGLPIIITPEAGAANEIVLHSINGYVLPLGLEEWARHAATLLSSPGMIEKMGANSLEIIKPYNFQNSADGIIAAARYATESPNSGVVG